MNEAVLLRPREALHQLNYLKNAQDVVFEQACLRLLFITFEVRRGDISARKLVRHDSFNEIY